MNTAVWARMYKLAWWEVLLQQHLGVLVRAALPQAYGDAAARLVISPFHAG
jgi:hypothetical protein